MPIVVMNCHWVSYSRSGTDNIKFRVQADHWVEKPHPQNYTAGTRIFPRDRTRDIHQRNIPWRRGKVSDIGEREIAGQIWDRDLKVEVNNHKACDQLEMVETFSLAPKRSVVLWEYSKAEVTKTTMSKALRNQKSISIKLENISRVVSPSTKIQFDDSNTTFLHICD